MIKMFSNKTTTPKITIQSKFLKNKTTIINANDEGYVDGINKNTLLFVKINVQGLNEGESIGNLFFSLAYENSSSTTTIKIIKCPFSSFTDATIKNFASSMTGNEIVEDTQIIYGADHSLNDENNLQIVTFDLTTMVKKSLGNNPTFIFVIANNYSANEGLKFYDPTIIANELECCNGTMTSLDGLNQIWKFDSHSIDSVGTGHVNLYTQKLIHIFEGLISRSAKVPISYFTIYNYDKSNEKQFLDKNLIPSFQYQIYQSGEDYVLENATGFKKYFKKIEVDSEEEKILFKMFGIKHSETPGILYYCSMDNSYFYLDQTTTPNKEKIVFYDKQDNKITFEVLLNESSSLKRFTKILSSQTKLGDTITYHWNGTKLEKITNSDDEEVLFSYDSSDRIAKVDFKNLKQYIEYSYVLNEWRINLKYCSYADNQITKLKEVQLNYLEVNKGNYQELLLSSVTDKITENRIVYSNSGTINSVSVMNSNGEKRYHITYSSNNYCTTLTFHDGKKLFYYFDAYGKCKLEMDDQGRTITYNYDEFENGKSMHLTSVSKIQTNSRNLLENHSFEDEDHLFQSNSLGWKKEGGTNQTTVKATFGGVYGEKYLLIDKATNETIYISQDIVSPLTNKVNLTGFIQYHPKNNNETISQGNIVVRVKGTYKTDEMVVTSVNSNTTTTEMRAVTHSYNEEINTFSGNSNWSPFSLSTTLPLDAYDITMKVEFVFSGIASVIGIDDLQLCASKQKTRYNFIENGYMEFVENNLPKGWLFENKESEDTLIEVASNDEHSPIFGNQVMRFVEGNIQEENTQFKCKKMYKKFSCKGLMGEQLVFSVFAKALATFGNIFRSYIKIYYTNGKIKYYTFDFDKNFVNWQMLTRAITTEYDYNQVEVGVEYSGGNEALFDAFQLYKDTYGKYYNYDQRGNITEFANENGSGMKIEYSDDNQVSEIYTQDGNSFKYNYDSQGRLEKIVDLSGNSATITYDDNDYIKTFAIETPEGETILQSLIRDQFGNIVQTTDEYGNITISGFNYLNQIQQIQYANGLVENYEYNSNLSLKNLNTSFISTSQTQPVLHQNSFDYYDNNLVKTIESENGTKYNFIYDSLGRIIEIKVNDTIINQFTYNEAVNGVYNELIKQKKYGDTGDYFDFIYNDDNQIISIKLNGSPMMEYQYNEDGQISKIIDVKSNQIKYFTYDLKGKLIKIVDHKNQVISYNYDNLNNIQKVSYQLNDLARSYDFEYDYETNEYSKEGYFHRIEKVFGDEMVKGGNSGKGTYGAIPIVEDFQEVYDTNLKMKVYDFTNNSQCIHYSFNSFNNNRKGEYSNGMPFNLENWRKRLYYNKTCYLWIKPTGTFTQENLIKFLRLSSNITEILAGKRINLSELKVLANGKIGYYSEVERKFLKETTNTLNLNEWNLIGVKLFKKPSESKSKCIIYLNGESSFEFEIAEHVTFISEIAIASQKDIITNNPIFTPALPLSMPFQICMISLGSYDYTSQDIKSIYSEGLKYLIGSSSIQKSTGVSYYNAEVYKDFDVITLNGSLESTKGNKPIRLVQTDTSFIFDKARIFKYDPDSKQHLYGAFDDVSNFTHGIQSVLAYQLNLTNQGVISLRFKLEETLTNNYRMIFGSFSGSLPQLALMVNNDNTFRIDAFNHVISTTKVMETNQWYHTIIFFKENQFSVYLDGVLVHSESRNINLENTITFLGTTSTATYPLNGYLEMFAYSNVYLSNEQFLAQSIYENGKMISIKNQMDSLGRLTKQVINTNKINNYTTIYNQEKLRMKREIEPDTHNIEYTYDNMGNIIKKQYKVKEYNLESFNYTYDKLGRLVEEGQSNGNVEKFTYDENGNILTHQIKDQNGDIITNEKYNYSVGIKDQLESITDLLTNTKIKEYKYENSYKGNPSKIITNGESKNLLWEGRRLKQIGDLKFTYNENGLRIKKETSSYDEEYILDGHKIIRLIHRSVDINYSLDFHYDEQGSIIGVHCNGKEYLYVKDTTGNISKIIDESGNTMVKYTYNAWGEFKKTIFIDGFISQYNPFIYKGYFYDSETNWYYLNNRYYDPCMKRFISMDNIIYLNKIGLNNINLFNYCENNPVSRFDPSGNSWKSFWKKISNWFKKTFAFSFHYGLEVGLTKDYYFLFSYEEGLGYSKSFDNDKPINLYIITPKLDEWWKLWEYSVGIDININGYGIGFYLGGETGISLHLGKTNIDLSLNLIGRLSIKVTNEIVDGGYVYKKFSFNLPEIAVTALAIYCYPKLSILLIELFKNLGGYIGNV